MGDTTDVQNDQVIAGKIIRKMSEQKETASTEGELRSIFRVPQNIIQEANRKFYEPQKLFIGPYHHKPDKPVLDGMDGDKLHNKPVLDGMEGPVLDGMEGDKLHHKPVLDGMEGPVLEGDKLHHKPVLDGMEGPVLDGMEGPVLEGDKLHHKPVLDGMEGDKLRYLDNLILRIQRVPDPQGSLHPRGQATSHQANSASPSDPHPQSGPDSQVDSRKTELILLQCIRKMKESEKQARSCYSDNITALGSDEFVQMMVLDGCFLLELLYKFSNRDERGNDPIFAVGGLLPLIRCDILKLENQIPFFILQHLFDIFLRPSGAGGVSLKALAFQYLTRREAPDQNELDRLGTVHHLLHFYVLVLRPPTSQNNTETPAKSTCTCSSLLPRSSPPPPPTGQRTPSTIPCAVALKEAGVKFRKLTPAKTFLDVTFAGSKLCIPPLPLDGSTNSIFRNLIALEQCYPASGDHFTSYVHFLDCIINTQKDVAILQERGIIENRLGSEEEAAQLINRLCEEVTINYRNHYLAKLFRDVNEYSESTWHRNWAKFKEDYFGTPWKKISLFVATALLVMTLIQTIYSVRSYNKPGA